MKKLMTLLSAATVAIGLYAYNDTGTSFDKAPNGAFDIATADDYPFNESGNTGLWATNGVLELTVVSNAQGEVQHLTDMFTALGSGAPADDQHLVVKSTFGNTLTRKIKSSGAQDINDGLYFDSTVKFTAFDQDPTNIAAIATEFADSETKIAVWVQTSEDESATNLYVRAGRLSRVNGELTVSSETYKCNTIRNVDAWHRLTIKAISDLYSSVETVPGFIVYLDGAPCGRDDAHDDAGVEPGKLNPIYEQWIGPNSIFPSLVQGRDGMALSSATFDGQGELDDIVFTEKAPLFAKDTEIVTVAWTPGEVTGLTIAGVAQDAATLEAGHTNLIFVGSSTDPMEVAVTGVTYAEDKCGVSSTNFSFTASGVTETIVAHSAAVSLDGVGYDTVADAVAHMAQGSSSVLKLFNTTANDELDLSDTGFDVTLDLNGQSFSNITAVACIVDSTTNLNVYGTGTVYGDVTDAAQIYAGNYEGMVIMLDAASSKIYGGRFNAEANTKQDLDPYACGGKVFVEENGYYVLAEGGGTVFTVTLTWDANETPVLYQINEYTPVDISGETSPFVISDVGSGTNVSFIVANADGAKKGYDVTVANANATIDATGATFGWPEYLGAAVDGAYQIDNLAELVLFQKGVAAGLQTSGETFKLTADVTLDAAWPGIGIQNGKDKYSTAEFDAGAFCGTFDGQNHTISGFQMIGGLDYCGFFNSTYGATIQNLKIGYLGALFATNTTQNSDECGATFVGVAKNSTLRNLTTVAGTVSCSKGFGGIVGYLTSGTTVDSCTNNVNLTSLKPNKAGGIAMITQNGSAVTISNCQNNGTIAGSNETGGLVGYIGLNTTIADCESTVAYKLMHHQNNTVTLSGVIKGNATVVSYTGAATPGLNFATVDGNVATFVADNALAADNTYKVMAPNATATCQLTAYGDAITFDESLATATFNITAASGLVAKSTVFQNGVVYAADWAATPAEHPWYENPGAVVLAENLPAQSGQIVSAFHGQGAGSYLGLTYSTNPLQFDLFGVDGTNALTTIHSVAAGDVDDPGFRGVAISETLGVAMTLAYATTTTMYTFPLAPVVGGNGQKAVTKPSTHSFDAAAFSPDGNYLFSNALNGESSNQFYVKWSVSADDDTGALALAKVGSISAGGRGRSLAYARINGRDLVFGLVDTGKVVVMDMTDADPANWTAADLITDLPALSYGTLCVSGVKVSGGTPHLTVATSINGADVHTDVLNVYALTVPATGAVTASLTKSFDEADLTAAGFGDISDANRYGNTVYVTEDEATIYFARPDCKLYAAQYAPKVTETYDAGSSTTFESAELATIEASMINANRSTRITVPEGISDENGAYTGLFYAYASGNTVTIGFTVEAAGDQATNVTANAVKQVPVADVAAAGASGTVEANLTGLTPGVWYSVLSRSTLAANVNEAWVESARVMADSTGAAKLVVPNKGNAGFYKVAANPADNSNSND